MHSLLLLPKTGSCHPETRQCCQLRLCLIYGNGVQRLCSTLLKGNLIMAISRSVSPSEPQAGSGQELKNFYFSTEGFSKWRLCMLCRYTGDTRASTVSVMMQKGKVPDKTRKEIPTTVQLSSSHSGGGEMVPLGSSALHFTFSSRAGHLRTLIWEENQVTTTSHPPGATRATRCAKRKEALCISSTRRLQSMELYLSRLFLYGGRLKPACFTHWAIQPPT